MLFYKIVCKMPSNEEKSAKLEERLSNCRNEVLIKSTKFNELCCADSFYFICDIKRNEIIIGALTEQNEAACLLNKYLKYVGIDPKNLSYVSEISFAAVIGLLNTAKRTGFIDDLSAILDRFNFNCLIEAQTMRMPFPGGRLFGSSECFFKEYIIEDCNKVNLFKSAGKYLLVDALVPELERIYSAPAKSSAAISLGHPVHYMLMTEPKKFENISKILLRALYANGRLSSRKCCFAELEGGGPYTAFANDKYEALYGMCSGGALVLLCNEAEAASGPLSKQLKLICETAEEYRNKVLTIFCLPAGSEALEAILTGAVSELSTVKLSEKPADLDTAVLYLKSLAKECGVRCDKKLFGELSEEKKYSEPELKTFFNSWYSSKLKNSVYPQYAKIEELSSKAKKKDENDAYDELMRMVGLKEAKELTDRLINNFKLQKLREQKGLTSEAPSMHMVFYGSPGTAKTTTARLLARILREKGILNTGQFIEVGRNDLIGKYVGWTAKIVKLRFAEAKGGVLFIDEAYSLLDDRRGSYGDEAVNTIVQEMENHREDTIVIFAGYGDKMKAFVESNPGIRSRIAFHLSFEDYSAKELCEIALLMCEKRNRRLGEGCLEKLEEIFEKARKQKNFGNGRYVRNLLENAEMHQSTRLLSRDDATLTAEDMNTLKPEDIEAVKINPQSTDEKNRKSIGFLSTA